MFESITCLTANTTKKVIETLKGCTCMAEEIRPTGYDCCPRHNIMITLVWFNKDGTVRSAIFCGGSFLRGSV